MFMACRGAVPPSPRLRGASPVLLTDSIPLRSSFVTIPDHTCESSKNIVVIPAKAGPAAIADCRGWRKAGIGSMKFQNRQNAKNFAVLL